MTIRQRDIQAALRAMRREGLEVERVVLTAEGAVVYPRAAGSAPGAESEDEIDEWLRNNGAPPG